MKMSEYAKLKGLTLEQLKAENMAFLQCEGYDDEGNEYETLNDWIDRKQTKQTIDPFDGGRGAGMLGVED